MDKYHKASVYCVFIFLILSVATTLLEFPFIGFQRELYLGGKIILHLWLLRVCFLVKKDSYRVSTNLQVGAIMMAFCIHGQYFSPWYMFAFNQLILAYSFLFALPKKVFNSFAVISAAIYLSMVWWRFENIQQWLNNDSQMDWMIVGVAVTVIAMKSHSFFTSDRTQRDALIRRFGLVGLQTASIVHDVKSMLATPRLNIEILRGKLAETSDSEVHELLQSVDTQLASIASAMTGLNQVVALQQQEREKLEVGTVVTEVADTLNFSARNIQLNIECNDEIHTEKAQLKSLIFNILMNTIQAFRNRRVQEPKIKVECKKSSDDFLDVIISDNAGGYSPEILKSISKEQRQRTSESGMGLFLIASGMQAVGGRVDFSNSENGAQVRLSFPQAILRKGLR
jgi:signal transduction histidine kinase